MKFAGAKVYSLKEVFTYKLSGPAYLILSSLVINVLTLALPIILMQVYDRIIGQGGVDTLLWLVSGGIIAILVESSLRLARFHLGSWILAQYEYRMGNNIFGAIFADPHRIMPQFNTGEVLELLRFPMKVKNLYSAHVFQVLLDLPFTAIFIVIIYFLNHKVGLYLLSLCLLYLVVLRILLMALSSVKDEQETIESKKTSFLIEVVSRIQMLKSLGVAENVLRKNEYIHKRNIKNEFRKSILSSLPQTINIFFSQANLFGILLLGSFDVMNGKMTIGMLTACTILGGRSFRPLLSIFSFWGGMEDLDRSGARVQVALNESEKLQREQLPSLPLEIEGSVTVKNLSYSYKDKKLFDDMTFHFESKKTYLLQGKSSGATTLMELIMGKLAPESGLVLWDNFDIAQFNRSNVYKSVSYISSRNSIYRGTILENVTLFNPANNDLAFECASLVGLDSIVAELPLGYNTVVDLGISKAISSSMTARIIVARALIERPKILVLDKLDLMLDSQTEEMLYWLLAKLKGIMTIIHIVDNAKSVEHVDHICELKDGKIEVKSFVEIHT